MNVSSLYISDFKKTRLMWKVDLNTYIYMKARTPTMTLKNNLTNLKTGNNP